MTENNDPAPPLENSEGAALQVAPKITWLGRIVRVLWIFSPIAVASVKATGHIAALLFAPLAPAYVVAHGLKIHGASPWGESWPTALVIAGVTVPFLVLVVLASRSKHRFHDGLFWFAIALSSIVAVGWYSMLRA